MVSTPPAYEKHPLGKCVACGNPVSAGHDFCPSCVVKLGAVLRQISINDGKVELYDLVTRVNTYNRSGVIRINAKDRPGWHKAIEVIGPIKCIICDGLTEDQVVCDDCAKSVAVIREVGAKQLQEIGQAIHSSGLVELASAVTKGLLADWTAEQMRKMEAE